MSRDYKVAAIVSDGRKELIQSFGLIPVQMCQFHEVAIMWRYFTKKPKRPASIKLKEVGAIMSLTDRNFFKAL